ncbi:hypothetical protein AAVH_38309 [Aphelenchoides avenae]|nr:hypothetical protein AAVH_38309 [Aphelenchus avenae]
MLLSLTHADILHPDSELAAVSEPDSGRDPIAAGRRETGVAGRLREVLLHQDAYEPGHAVVPEMNPLTNVTRR